MYGVLAATYIDPNYLTDIYLNPPFHEVSYIIGQYNSTFYYMKNGTSGNIDYKSTDASSVINSAFNNLTVGRTWNEVVALRGNFAISTALTPSSYTTVDLRNANLKASVVVRVFNLANQHDIDIFGGTIEGSGLTTAGYTAGVR